MDSLTIGVWQGTCRDGDLEANFARSEEVIGMAAAADCDFVCLPEMYLTGSGSPENVERCAMTLDDGRLLALAAVAQEKDVVVLVGMSERQEGSVANTQAVLDGGRVAGHYSKTMLTGGDRETMLRFDDELPVFEAKGVRFGVIICHDSSFPEVAATMAWKGAQIIFAPHFNNIAPDRMDEHRVLVRNNNIGIACHYNVVVARSNVVGDDPAGKGLRYGDSAIFSPLGVPLAEAGLFREALVTADVAEWMEAKPRWRNRVDLRPAIIRQLAEAALGCLGEA